MKQGHLNVEKGWQKKADLGNYRKKDTIIKDGDVFTKTERLKVT